LTCVSDRAFGEWICFLKRRRLSRPLFGISPSGRTSAMGRDPPHTGQATRRGTLARSARGRWPKSSGGYPAGCRRTAAGPHRQRIARHLAQPRAEYLDAFPKSVLYFW